MIKNEGYRRRVFRIAIGITILITLQVAGAATLTVNASGGADYTRIQDAINNASNGDTILVSGGATTTLGGATTTLTYYENVNINKPVNIIGSGANNTTIQASNPNAHVLFISASNVNIGGFAIKGATGVSYAGVYMQSVTGVTISNSTISNNYRAINLKSASSNKILNNSISSNSAGILFESSSNNNRIIGNTVSNTTFAGSYTGNGISTGDQSSSDTLIENNTVYSNTGSGIVGYAGSNNMRITGNTAYNNGGFGGIVIGWSSGVVIENNTAYNNSGYGISIDTASNNIIRNNNIFGNNQDGIGLWGLGMSDNLIHNNIISSNQYAGILVFSGVRDNTIRNNIISQNQYGILIDGNIGYPNYGNTIYYNNIIGNTHQAVDNSSQANYWNSSYPTGGNYWSDYTGTDIKSGANNDQPGSDGIGDTPYNISGGAGAQDRYPFMSQNGWLNSGELRGDVNGNGRRDTGDATLILRSIVGLPIPAQYQPVLPIGDMNCNGRIDTGDATLVLRDVVGLSIPKCW